ncbi:MAG: hypothetical protein ACYC4Q_12515 [Victivallaceae bacterium]
MNNTAKRTIIGASVLFSTAIAMNGAFAEQAATTTATSAATATGGTVQKAHKEGQGPFKEIRAQIEAKIKAFIEEKRKEHQAFKESIKDKTPTEQKPLIDQFREKMLAETKTFIAQQREDFTAKVQNGNFPEERKAEFLKKMQERWSKVDAHIEKQFQKNKQTLDSAFSDGVVTKEEKENWKKQRKAQMKDNKEFRGTLKDAAQK